MELLTMESALALLTLTILEIVLGIDNIVVIAIITGRLEQSKQAFARKLGLGMAMLMRILLLLSLSWLMGLTKPLFSIASLSITTKDLILIVGGVFLIWKATHEIHTKIEGDVGVVGEKTHKEVASVHSAVFQILMLDLVFSLDSVITAIGMANKISIMVIAVVIAVIVMMIFVNSIAHFIEKHPTIKILALSFLLLIGVVLVAEGLHKHIEKGYLYFAMGFSLVVEMLNLKVIKKHHA